MFQTAGLRNVEIFQGLPDEEVEIVAEFCREESLHEGITLCKAFVDYF